MQRIYKKDIARYKAGTRSILTAALEKDVKVYSFIENERIFILEKNGKRVWLRGPRLSISNPVSLWIIKDKHLTKEVLRVLQIPCPDGYSAKTLEEAVSAAEKIKFPLVIKPRRYEGGRGVFLNVNSIEKLRVFFKKSMRYDSQVLLEKEVFGKYYRITMIDHKIAGILETSGLFLVGNGSSSIKQLIRDYNKKSESFYKITTKTKDILSFQGLSLESIPKKNEQIQLSFSGSEGGRWIDKTDEICSENVILLSKLTKYLDLNIVGIDLIAKNISMPITSKKYPGYILELNGAPEFIFHLKPSAGKSRNIGEKIINMLFKAN